MSLYTDEIFWPPCSSSFEEIKKELEHIERFGNYYDVETEHYRIACQLIEDFNNDNNPLIRVQAAICLSQITKQRNSHSLIYTDSQIEKVLRFYIQELKNMNKDSEHYSEYCNLLKKLKETKAFSFGFELRNEETKEKIFEDLFTVLFNLVDDNLGEDLKSCILSILNSIIKKSKGLSFNHLFNLFLNILEPLKKSRKAACEITIQLLQERSKDLKGFLTNYINLIIEQGHPAIENCSLYEIAYELRNIFPNVISNRMLVYATWKIKSVDENERTAAVSFLGKMFAASDSTLAKTNVGLFKNFLLRIKDPSLEIRLLQVGFFKRIILRHPEVREQTSRFLRATQVDPEVKIRIEGVSAISEAIFKDPRILEENEYLKSFLQGVEPDPEYSVREAELSGMGIVFKEYIRNLFELSPELRNALLSIQTRIFYAYSATGCVDDKNLIKRIFRELLVPYELSSKERMKRLLHLYSTLNFFVLHSFANLHEGEFLNRIILAKWLEFLKDPESRDQHRKEFNIMTKYRKDSMGSPEFVKAFENLLENPLLVNQLEMIVSTHISCRERIKAFQEVKNILTESKEPFWEEAYQFITGGGSLIIDNEGIKDLIDFVFEALEGGSILQELDLNQTAGDRGLKLLQVFANYFSSSFDCEEIPKRFIYYLEMESNPVRRSLAISILATLGKRKPLYEILEKDSLEFLISFLKIVAVEGTPKESKQAIRCLKVSRQDFDLFYEEILERMKSTLLGDSAFFLGSVVALGHIAIERTEGKCQEVENLIQRVFDDLRNHETEFRRSIGSDWCVESELSKKERSLEEGIKSLVRCIYDRKCDPEIFQDLGNEFLSLLDRFLKEPYSRNEPTKNRLRAKAACSILKIYEREELRYSIPLKNFYDLSKLMNDESLGVRKLFIKKLIKGLKEGLPKQFLSNEFLGYFILIGREDLELMTLVNSAFKLVIERRNFFVNYLMNSAGSDIHRSEELKKRLFDWLPEFSILYALPILARDPDFTEFNYKEFKRMETYIWQFLQPIVKESSFKCSVLFKTIGEKLKSFGDAQSPEFNEKLAVLNEIFLKIVDKRIKEPKKTSAKLFEVELKIPTTHYTEFEFVDFHHEHLLISIQKSDRKSNKKKFPMDSSVGGKRSKSS